MTIRESRVERYLKQSVEHIGGEVRKVKWVGRRAAPDRLVMFKGAWFVELKRPGEFATGEQIREHAKMNDNGVNTRVISSMLEVDNFIEFLKRYNG